MKATLLAKLLISFCIKRCCLGVCGRWQIRGRVTGIGSHVNGSYSFLRLHKTHAH